MIQPLTPPLEKIKVKKGGKEIEILRYCEAQNYNDHFGYLWEKYNRTYTDSVLGANVSLSRLEAVLGFPVEFLKGMNVLEVGCGAGRFTEHFAKYAKAVVAVEMSSAIKDNVALDASNVLPLQADLTELPKFSEPIDLVFMRGVLQYTPDPKKTLSALFSYVREGGLVIFDVYKKTGAEWRNPKYFWRPFFRKYIPAKKCNDFISRHDVFLYKTHHRFLKIVDAIPFLRPIISRTPFYLSTNWNNAYPNLNKKQRIEIAKNEIMDVLYPEYDNPLTTEEVVNILASIGQIPYSHDNYRNQFRIKKQAGSKPIKVRITKNGVLPVVEGK
jgi:SAM-dependent methyltransferase